MADLKITSISELKEMASGEIVELPPFSNGYHFVARLRRPSMLGLAGKGKIPNVLLTRANEMFNADGSGQYDVEDEKLMVQMYEIFELMCEECFVEPTYKQLKDNNIELTDEQMMFVFNYTQSGIKKVENFRSDEEDNLGSSDVENLPGSTV